MIATDMMRIERRSISLEGDYEVVKVVYEVDVGLGRKEMPSKKNGWSMGRDGIRCGSVESLVERGEPKNGHEVNSLNDTGCLELDAVKSKYRIHENHEEQPPNLFLTLDPSAGTEYSAT